MKRTCAACKRDFEDTDNGLFLTCHSCRRPDPIKNHPARFEFDTKGSGLMRHSRSRSEREDTRATKYGID